jgi:hypothetical protein
VDRIELAIVGVVRVEFEADKPARQELDQWRAGGRSGLPGSPMMPRQ